MTSLVVVEDPDVGVVLQRKRSKHAQTLLNLFEAHDAPTIEWDLWVELFNARLAKGSTLSSGTLAQYRKAADRRGRRDEAEEGALRKAGASREGQHHGP